MLFNLTLRTIYHNHFFSFFSLLPNFPLWNKIRCNWFEKVEIGEMG